MIEKVSLNLCMAAATLSCTVAAAAMEPVPQRLPNVIVIVADDLGYGDLSLTGAPDIRTPNIDSLARNGSTFSNAYISAPVCLPSRMGLMTGNYQEKFGVQTLEGPGGTRDFAIPADRPTLAENLKLSGYRTGAIGKWHLGETPQARPNARGFDEFYGFLHGSLPYFPDRAGQLWRNEEPVPKTRYMTDDFGEEAVDFIKRHHEHPFFLYLAFSAVHLPLEATDEYLEPYRDIRDPSRRKYAAMTAAMDANIGKVLDALKAYAIEGDTLVFFLSDNGGFPRRWSLRTPFRGGKYELYEGGIRTPFLVQWPHGGVPAGGRFDQPVIALDIAPTVLVAAGGKHSGPHELDGTNLLPLMRSEATEAPHERLYWRYGPYMAAMREGDYKIIKNGVGSNRDPQWQLFNLVDDPSESEDLSVRMPDRFKDMIAAFDAWDQALPEPRFLDQRLVNGIAWWEVKDKVY